VLEKLLFTSNISVHPEGQVTDSSPSVEKNTMRRLSARIPLGKLTVWLVVSEVTVEVLVVTTDGDAIYAPKLSCHY
jgi:hypothetical protein